MGILAVQVVPAILVRPRSVGRYCRMVGCWVGVNGPQIVNLDDFMVGVMLRKVLACRPSLFTCMRSFDMERCSYDIWVRMRRQSMFGWTSFLFLVSGRRTPRSRPASDDAMLTRLDKIYWPYTVALAQDISYVFYRVIG